MKEKAVLSNALLMFLLLAIFGAGLVTPVMSLPDVIRVPDDYPTIQEAIDAASPGNTIVVREGLYAEGQIDVNKPLTLIADGRVVVDGLHTAWSVFWIRSDNVVVDGFIAKNALYEGISLGHVDSCRIEANTVENNLVGIWIGNGGYDNVVKGNKILNNYIGIFLSGMFWPTEYNVVEKNVAENNSYAIDLWYSRHNVIRYNTLNNNNNASIIIHFSDHNTIKENRVTNTDQVGIALLVSHHNLVNENKVTNNGMGIGLSGSGWNTLEENKVNRNTIHGIALYWSYARNTIEENVALGNKEFDLYWNGEGTVNLWIENRYKTKTDNIIQDQD